MNGEICEVCGREVKVSIFKNTGVCCELCRKLRAGEITREKYDKEFGSGIQASTVIHSFKQ